MLTQENFAAASKLFDIEVAAIKAVAKVESGRDGFLPDGKPVILFEPHIFYKRIKGKNTFPKDYYIFEPVKDAKGEPGQVSKKVLNPKYEDILYERWKTKPYGKTSEQWGKMERAMQIDKQNALASASWGMFQIMGFNWDKCDCKSLDEFVEKMSKDEEEQLKLFLSFLCKTGLDKHLRAKNWEAFARGYNGPGYKDNRYDTKMEQEYKKLKSLP